jgi:thiamine biosynthesis lipoprotein
MMPAFSFPATADAAAVPVAERRFRAMGTTAHVVVVGPTAARDLDAAVHRLVDLERRWSRFLPDSEISRLNAAGGKATLVSADTYRVIDLAVQAWQATGGCFDPTVLPALRARGYDRPFAALGDQVWPETAPPRPAPGCADVQLDAGACAIQVPAGVELDLGGVGKGAAADLVVEELIERGAAGACVNVGGDVRVDGDAPTPRGWIVALRVPGLRVPGLRMPLRVRAVALASGGVCTSSTQVRRWTTTAGTRHHLIDPASGLPIDNGLVAVTVIGARAAQAEILTKVAFVAGPEAAPARLAPLGVAAVLVLDDGSTVQVGNLEEMAA